jgi:UDP-2,4-diacetamido-2,4,6-trideoxy-beta-L-altropyranose hydrolase
MVSADLAIGAGGGATWERLCVGLPSIVFSLAPNQDAVCWELSNLGLINFAGRLEDFNDAAFSATLIQLIEDPVRRRDQALKGQALVDGFGASRIAELLMPTRTDHLVCRSATVGDMLSYFDWANDSAVRTSAMNTSPIPLEDHIQWFTDKLRSANSWLFVLEAQGIAVGQVRFDREDDGVWIDYSLDRLVRGRGWGPQLIRMGAESLPLPAGTVLKARVKKANAASAAVFRRLEFSESGAGDVLVFTTQLGRLRT